MEFVGADALPLREIQSLVRRCRQCHIAETYESLLHLCPARQDTGHLIAPALQRKAVFQIHETAAFTEDRHVGKGCLPDGTPHALIGLQSRRMKLRIAAAEEKTVHIGDRLISQRRKRHQFGPQCLKH